MPGGTAGREEGVAVPSPATEGAPLPADDVLARLGSGTSGPPGGRSGTAAAGGGPERGALASGACPVGAGQSAADPAADAAGGDRHVRRRTERGKRLTAPTGGRQYATRRAASKPGTPSSRRQASVS